MATTQIVAAMDTEEAPKTSADERTCGGWTPDIIGGAPFTFGYMLTIIGSVALFASTLHSAP